MKFILSLCACLLLGTCCGAGEDPGNNRQNGPDGGGGRRGGGPGGGGVGGPGFGGGGGGGGGAVGITRELGTGFGGMNANTVTSRLLGMDLEQLKRSANIEQLPLTETRRFITRIPVGGVDNFVMSGNGWKMEGVFKLTPEQTKTVDALRDEYSAEQKKLAKEIYEEELKLAQKVTDLRAKYEQKANDVLAGADKEAKQQMDALSLEIQTKITGVVKDAIELYDVNDLNQAMNFAQAMREKVNALYQSGEDRLTTLVPAEARAKIQEMMKRQTEAGQNPFGGRRGFQVGDRPMRGAGGAGAGDAGAAVQPPKAPPDQF